jgi:hypothetical protein
MDGLPSAIGWIGNRDYCNNRTLHAQGAAAFADCSWQIASRANECNRTTIFNPDRRLKVRGGVRYISRSLCGPVDPYGSPQLFEIDTKVWVRLIDSRDCKQALLKAVFSRAARCHPASGRL